MDEKVFAFKHGFNNWLKGAVEVRSKKESRNSSSSKHPSTSSKSRREGHGGEAASCWVFC